MTMPRQFGRFNNAAALVALAIISVPAPAQTSGLSAKLDAAEKQLSSDIEACKQVDLKQFDALVAEANKNWELARKMALKSKVPFDDTQLSADKARADKLRAAAKAANCDLASKQYSHGGSSPPPDQETKVEPPVLWKATAASNFGNAIKLYEAAKGRCDAANMIAARAQMDAAIALQRAALDGSLKGGATAIAEKLKAELKAMEEQYWSVDSSIRKCAPPQVGYNPYLQPEKKASINPMAVAVIAGQAGQGDAPQAGPMPGGWTGMTPVNSPQMGPEIKGFYEEKGHALGSEMASSGAAVLGTFDKYVPDNPGLGGFESAELGKDFDRFMKTIEPYPEAIKSEADDALHVGLEWTLNGEKIQPYADTKVDQPELPSNYWTPRPVNVDPDYSGPMEIDLYPNAPIYLGTDTPKPVEPDPAPGGALLDVRLLHHLQELAGIGRKRLDIPPLPFRIDGVEGEAGLARPAEAGDDRQALARDIDIDSLEVVLPGTAHRNMG
jgi:hypothetical protein